MLVNYSLYSLRIANMKAVYNEPAKIATLIGHISIETQSEHFGKRRNSWSLRDIRRDPAIRGAGRAGSAESEAKRPPIPTEGGHRFRSKAASQSDGRRPPC
jgi:hypothetical protein